MNESDAMSSIQTISHRKILNSHVEFTNEFIIQFDNGCIGIGSAPIGETVSIYEDRNSVADPQNIIETINNNQYFNVPLNQQKFDDYLESKISVFGRNNCFALSFAFFNAINKSTKQPYHKTQFPNLCLNVLNGGKHAYTNPVLSEFPEYLLVARTNKLIEVIEEHNRIQKKVREELITKKKIVVNGNLVNTFATTDNRECIDFLLGILERLNLTDRYDLMIDASGTDLWTEQGYRFALTDNSLKTSQEFYRYWINLVEEYNIKFLENPFHETDYEAWKKLTTTQKQCNIIGDNLYSTDLQRIQQGSNNKYTNGVMIKPNQAGTVSATLRAIETAQKANQIVITSHRSISTESAFLAWLTHACKVKYVKIGPLYTDYSSVIRLNELIRLTEMEY
jgi:enolase